MEPGDARGLPPELAYPERLRQAEEELIRARRRNLGDIADAPRVGLALSGGGIRSATFCLGVVQSLARARLLGRFDYLSTVSGGGYTGSFLTQLYSRGYVCDAEDLQRRLSSDAAPPPPGQPDPLEWLRQNSRYLAPTGGGDLLFDVAVVIRNWVALQAVVLSFLAMVFCGLQLLRTALDLAWPQPPSWLPHAVLTAWSGNRIQYSPWLDLLLPWPLLAMLLAGAAYWLVGFGAPLSFGLPKTDRGLQRDTRLRNALSRWLARALGLALCCGLLALVDSLGQTLYVLCWVNRAPLTLAAAFAAGVAVVTRLASVGGYVKQFADKLGAGVALSVLSGIAAWLLILAVLGGADALSHAVAWHFRQPPVQVMIAETPISPAGLPGGKTGAPSSAEHPAYRLVHDDPADAVAGAKAFAVLLLACLVLGRAWPFLNRSSQHPLYSDRLTRAYLGASNADRTQPGQSAITDPIFGDDSMCPDCWTRAAYGKGAPLHLINVTINETASARAKTTLRDRKGIGMAIGPGGISAGVRHHACFGHEGDCPEMIDDGTLQPLLPRSGWSMFGDGAATARPERLSLGQWMAISGAAFSTGMGARTSFALSVLTGFANVRLGYWWDCGVAERPNPGRSAARRLNHLFHRLLPLQACLFSEFTAAFHGPDERHWYLSDGGAFENMGGYELIRRRLPMIVIVDGEEDPDYTTEGLANLVRKARMDFGAEIRFLDQAALDALRLPPELAACFVHPRQLRPDAEGYSAGHAGLATVCYDGAAEPASLILYLKPTLKPDVPVDVRQYQLGNKPFPQQPTYNQFFDEEQWESYRRLGEYIADKVFAPGTAAWLPRQLCPPPPWLL